MMKATDKQINMVCAMMRNSVGYEVYKLRYKMPRHNKDYQDTRVNYRDIIFRENLCKLSLVEISIIIDLFLQSANSPYDDERVVAKVEQLFKNKNIIN